MPHSGRIRLAVLMAGMLAVSGCFVSNESPDASGSGARLRLGLAFPPAKAMSPYSDDAALLVRMGAGETLVTLESGGAPAPLLAESWSKVDDTTWRFRLRGNVKFHDGTAFTAQHAAAALTHATHASPVPRALSGIGLAATAVEDRVLDVRTKTPDPVLPQRLSSPELVMLAPTAYANPAAPNPVRAATGPYLLEEVSGTTSARLSANQGYWDGKPAAAGVDVRFIVDGASRAGALRTNEIDIAHVVPVAQIRNITEQEIREVPLPRSVLLYLNSQKGVFTDPALRAAARGAVDSAELTNSIYEKRADPAVGIFGPASPWAAARPARTPAAAGRANGQPVRLATYKDRPELPELASALAEKLRGRGFTVEVTVREYSTMESELLAGAFDAVIGNRSYLLDTGDPISFLANDFGCAGGYNLARFCDQNVDRAIAQAAGQLEPGARQAAAVQIEATVLGSDAVVPLAHERTRIGVGRGVSKVAEDAFERRLVTRHTVRS